MTYSSAGILALIIHLIINHDVFRNKTGRDVVPANRSYHAFLLAVSAYYVTDICWGLLYERKLMGLVFADTSLYFFTMACSILFWTRYVVDYLREEHLFGKLLKYFGWLIFWFQIIVVIMNYARPVLFTFDAEGVYRALSARYVTLVAQIVMFLTTAVYALVVAARSGGTMRARHRTIGLFSLAMAGFIVGQAVYPLLPLYAIGCMLGGCVLHSFVLENEKEEYRDQLEFRLQENILKGNYYDLLTGLPGMTYFFELAKKKRDDLIYKDGEPAFLFMDLSGMKFYNQRHGFAEGDRLLQLFARMLISSFGSENCSRFGQDHFVVFTERKGLQERLDNIFKIWGMHEYPAIRVGIFLDRSGKTDISTACDCAKAARDAIRHSYISSVRYFDSAMLADSERRQYIISHLDRAIAEKWIQVYYQPIVRAVNGRVCDEEALARWNDPERGFLSPGEFIPILEEANLIYKLDLYVVEQVLEKIREIESSGLFLVPQSVNLSRSDFDVCDMVEEIRARMDTAGIPHDLLSIEITESIVGSNLDFIRTQIDRFRALGFSVWMDDFGSGYSSLDVLSNIQVDLIKLDMRFMQQCDEGEKGKVILTELMRMITKLGVETVCEGVERQDQEAFLREIGCTKLQGYYYTKPIPKSQILRRYREGIQIGFENPAESAYYDAIGSVNLYDLDRIAKDEASMQNYFSTIPMAIIEVQETHLRFSRSNPAYRDFMERTSHVRFAEFGDAYEEDAPAWRKNFAAAIRQCCREDSRSVFDETLPDGTMLHAYMRRIAENPLTGTVAVVVAILAVTDDETKA